MSRTHVGMSTYDESLHPRAASGEFTTKVNRAPSDTLDAEVPAATRRIAEHNSDFFPADELAARGLTEDDVIIHDDEVIDIASDMQEPTDLEDVREWLSDGGNPVSEVTICRDYDDDSRANVDISVYENFEHLGFSEEELDEHADVIKSVYAEWFNAELDVYEDWDSVRVSIRTTMLADGATPLLVLEQAHGAHAKYLNETDRGTFGSPYVGSEIDRRIEAAKSVAA